MTEARTESPENHKHIHPLTAPAQSIRWRAHERSEKRRTTAKIEVPLKAITGKQLWLRPERTATEEDVDHRAVNRPSKNQMKTRHVASVANS